MSQSQEDRFEFEDEARASMWAGFRYFELMQRQLHKDVDRCSKELLTAKSAAGSGDLTP
jgi:hypothetical protein